MKINGEDAPMRTCQRIASTTAFSCGAGSCTCSRNLFDYEVENLLGMLMQMYRKITKL